MIGDDGDLRPVVALDWSFHGVHVTFDGVSVQELASVEALLADARLSRPHRIAAEATFESWDPQRRTAMLAALHAAGHELFVYRPLHTARARKVLRVDKSDAADALIIWRYAQHPRFRLYRYREVDREWAARFTALQREYVRLRLTGGKAALAAAAAQVLGPLRERSPQSRAVLGSSSGYSETLLAVLAFAAGNDLTRNEMERLVGLHGSGYPSLLRSEVHTHNARHALKRLAAFDGIHAGRAVHELDDPTVSVQVPDRSTQKDWRVYRREMRRAYAELVGARRAGTFPPAG